MWFWLIFMHFLWLNFFFNEEEDVDHGIDQINSVSPVENISSTTFCFKELYAFSSEYQLVINQIRNIKQLIFTLRKTHVSHVNSGRNY